MAVFDARMTAPVLGGSVPLDHSPSKVGGAGLFQLHQPEYAAHGIATFPVDGAKKPRTRHYQRVGRSGSARLAEKFGDADAFGFMTGPRSGITVLDIDSPDPSDLAAALQRHGDTPVVVRSGSGNHQAWYRHNGERRGIRPWGKSCPVDLLGGGLVVAPPSRTAKGSYQFIRGGLDDLDRLPVMSGLDATMFAVDAPAHPAHLQRDLGDMREGDGRNKELFRQLAREAHCIGSFDALLEKAMALNSGFAEPMAGEEVDKIARSVDQLTREGRNRFGRHGSYIPVEIVNRLSLDNPDALLLLSFLNANQGPNSTFVVSNALAGTRLCLSRKRLAAARRCLLEVERAITQVRPDIPRQAALYRWNPRWRE